jgi:hypothetical protein
MTNATVDISTLTPPVWVTPDTQPECLRLADGGLVFTWQRHVSAAVWIGRVDRAATAAR